MNLFDKISKKFGIKKKTDKKAKTEETTEKRNEAKLNLAVKCYQNGFSDDEVERILSVIQSAEDDIQIIKNSLINANNNSQTDDSALSLKNGIEKIKARQAEMKKELDETIAEIKASKKKD